ncbi:hypothetical protein V8F06_006030 [Rhypophila decipiens]
MEHPVRDVRNVIRALCQGSPQEQSDAVNRYFVPSASFVHPFCRVPSFEGLELPIIGAKLDSRTLVLAIFKWYKILSPKIELEIDSVVFDQRSNLLYLTIHQVFSIWFIPFYKAPVKLVTVLHLVPSNQQQNNGNSNGNGGGDNDGTPNHDQPNSYHHLNGTGEDEPSYAEVAAGEAHPSSSPSSPPRHGNNSSGGSRSQSSGGGSTRYLIKKQEDYYQVNEFLKFVLGMPGAYLWYGWQVLSTFFCILGAVFLGPVTYFVGPYVIGSKPLPQVLQRNGSAGGSASVTPSRIKNA